jgi:hypothetical protein
LVDKSNLLEGPCHVLKPLANYKTEGEKLLAFNSKVVGDKGVIEMTKKIINAIFNVMGKHFLWVTFFWVCFPFIYICLLFTRQVYRTFPSLIEDVGLFIYLFIYGGGGGNLIIIIAQKKIPQKIKFVAQKRTICFFYLPNLLGFNWGKHIPSHPISQTKPKKIYLQVLFCGALLVSCLLQKYLHARMGIGHQLSPFLSLHFGPTPTLQNLVIFVVFVKEVPGTKESRGIRFSLLTLGSLLMTHALVMRGKLVEICLSSFLWDGWMDGWMKELITNIHIYAPFFWKCLNYDACMQSPLTKVNYGFIGKIKIGKSKETQNSHS